jgi:hypothetical protein
MEHFHAGIVGRDEIAAVFQASRHMLICAPGEGWPVNRIYFVHHRLMIASVPPNIVAAKRIPYGMEQTFIAIRARFFRKIETLPKQHRQVVIRYQ